MDGNRPGGAAATHVDRGDAALADRAARVSKCDLLTAMVGEFPELQGLMGRYYAQHDGEPAEVCEALAISEDNLFVRLHRARRALLN